MLRIVQVCAIKLITLNNTQMKISWNAVCGEGRMYGVNRGKGSNNFKTLPICITRQRGHQTGNPK